MARTTIRTLAALACSTLLAIAGSLLTASTAAADHHEGANACPELTQTKYPFVTCTPNDYGGVALSIPGLPAPLVCHLLVDNGDCAASFDVWRLAPFRSPKTWPRDIPHIAPWPTP